MKYINFTSGRKTGHSVDPSSLWEKREIRDRRNLRRNSRVTPVAVEPPLATGEIQVSGFSDQTGCKWILVNRDDQSAVARVGSLNNPGASIWAELAEQGLLVTRSKSKQMITNEIEDLRDWPQRLYAATRAGYHCGGFVKPDGQVIGKPRADHFRVVLSGPPVALSQSGTLESWKAMVARYAQDQVIYTTLVCASFIGPILELFPSADNVCLFLVGETSGGKSTGLDLYCTVWGAPHQQPGSIGISLRSTSVGLERHMMVRSAAAFAADEVNLLGSNSRQQGDRVYDLAFMVSHGVEKERANDPARARVQQSFLATSNVPLPRLLDGQDQSNAEAVLARFHTLPADAGAGLGVLDHLPAGFKDSQPAIDALKDAMSENHGTAADAFLRKLVRARRVDEVALRGTLEVYRERFVRLCQVHSSDRAGLRRARSFGLIYAAGRIAREWRISPLRRLKPLLLEAYRRSAAADAHNLPPVRLSPLQRIEAYIEANRSDLIDLDAHEPIEMSKKEVNEFPGFLKTLKGRRCLLIKAGRWNLEFGSQARRLLDQLDRQNRLYATENLQTQTRVRTNETKDRVYAIRID
ncbi:MAG: DUF927 domain-containing protein [Pseudorhizobium sp.]